MYFHCTISRLDVLLAIINSFSDPPRHCRSNLHSMMLWEYRLLPEKHMSKLRCQPIPPSKDLCLRFLDPSHSILHLCSRSVFYTVCAELTISLGQDSLSLRLRMLHDLLWKPSIRIILPVRPELPWREVWYSQEQAWNDLLEKSQESRLHVFLQVIKSSELRFRRDLKLQ